MALDVNRSDLVVGVVGTGAMGRGIAHAAQGHCLQQNLFCVLGTERRWV